mgnify:CR=1 FL=1
MTNILEQAKEQLSSGEIKVSDLIELILEHKKGEHFKSYAKKSPGNVVDLLKTLEKLAEELKRLPETPT